MKAQLSWLKRLLLDQVFLLIVICIIGLFTPWNQLLKSAEEILLAIREQAQVAPIPTAIGYVLSFIGMTAISFPRPDGSPHGGLRRLAVRLVCHPTLQLQFEHRGMPGLPEQPVLPV